MIPIDPALRDRAVVVGRAALSGFGDRSTLASYKVFHPTTWEPAHLWSPHSLAHGDPGQALVLGVADRLWPDQGWDRRAHEFIQASLRTPVPSSPIGLYGGVSGVALALRTLSRGGERYTVALDHVEENLYTRLGGVLGDLPEEGGLASADYDHISGLSGVAGYLLTTVETDDRAREPLGAVLDRFVSWSDVSRPGTGFWTPGDKLNPVERQHAPELHGGYLNLGLSHGVAAPVAVLSLAHRNGLAPSGTREAVTRLVDTLVTRAEDTDWGPDVPYHALPSPSAPRASTASRPPARTAWCYGNPGVARAVQLAAHAFDRPDWESFGTELLRSALRRPDRIRQADSPTLCHGRASLVHVLSLFLRDSTTHDPELVTALTQELDTLLAAHAPGSPFGFRDTHPHQGSQDHPGFLEGAAGVIAVLLSLAPDAPTDWERSLMTG